MKYIITTILVLLTVVTNAQVNDSLAQRLLRQEIVYWQAPNDSVRFYSLLAKAKTDRGAGVYSDALNELFRAEKFCFTKQEKADMDYEKMLNYFLTDAYSFCSEITIDSTNIAAHFNEYLTMKLYSMNEAEKWDRCKEIMITLCNKNDTALQAKIEQLPVSYNYKNPEKCRRMSAILPGLGETYAGYPFKGFTSFIINGGFLFFAGYNFYTAYYVTGVISGLYPFIRFHAGGKRLSAILADRHNDIESGKVKKQYWEEINLLLH